jgi:AraC-like DNA-binding protein
LIEQKPNTKIAEIAYECGYTDHSAFSRQFKAYAGMSPTEYGSRVRQGSHAAG